MRTIWKWKLEDPVSILEMPLNAEIIAVNSHFGEPQLWAIVLTEYELVKRKFVTFDTGHEIPSNVGPYIGTIQSNVGSLNFHVFEDLSYKDQNS